jgi:ATP synthase protein I
MMERLVRAQPINHLLKMQFMVLVITSLIVLCFHEINSVIAYLYGGVIAVFNTLLQRKHLYAAAKYAKADASKNLGRAYRCIAERWMLTIVLFAVGFLVLIPVKSMLAAFIIMQMVVLFGNYNRA